MGRHGRAGAAARHRASTTLEPPLGSGPYRIKSFEPGRTIVYERVPDYWAKDLPVNVGMNNFDEIRYDEYRDTTVLLEAFKGDQYDFRAENSAKNWATGYDFPAGTEGRVDPRDVPGQGVRRDAGLRAEPAAPKVPGPARAAGAELCLRLRER